MSGSSSLKRAGTALARERKRTLASHGVVCSLDVLLEEGTIVIEVRNIHGVRTSTKALTASYRARPLHQRPHLLVFLETMASKGSRWKLDDYRILGAVHAERKKAKGRPSGGVIALLRSDVGAPIQVLVTGTEPPNCYSCGRDAREGKAMALVTYYRVLEEELLADFFDMLDTHTETLKERGFKVLTMGRRQRASGDGLRPDRETRGCGGGRMVPVDGGTRLGQTGPTQRPEVDLLQDGQKGLPQ